MTLKDDGDIVKGLGYLALYAAYVEEAIDNCVDVMTSCDSSPYKNIDYWPVSKKIQFMIKKVSVLELPVELGYFDGLLNTLLELFEQRNKLIHGRIYASLQGESDVLRPGRKNELTRNISSAELYELANFFCSSLKNLNHASLYSLPRLMSKS